MRAFVPSNEHDSVEIVRKVCYTKMIGEKGNQIVVGTLSMRNGEAIKIWVLPLENLK